MRLLAEFQDAQGGMWSVQFNESTLACSIHAPDGTERESLAPLEIGTLKEVQEKKARDRCAELAGWPINPKTGHRGWDLDDKTGTQPIHGKRPEAPKADVVPDDSFVAPPLPLRGTK